MNLLCSPIAFPFNLRRVRAVMYLFVTMSCLGVSRLLTARIESLLWTRLPLDKLLCLVYCTEFVLASSRLSDSRTSEDAHLSANQFDWLGTIFYFSYLLFQYPQNLALQRFPVGKWMTCVLDPIYHFPFFIYLPKLKHFPLGDHSVLPRSL